jgi:hypothetical protein
MDELCHSVEVIAVPVTHENRRPTAQGLVPGRLTHDPTGY